MAEPPPICRASGQEGMMFPATEWEHDLHDGLRAFLYGVGLLYSFMGVAVVADVFMSAIEAVTSRKVSKALPNGRRKTGKLWNETVATLTLMALGSSAPEIFLAIIDIVKRRFHFGELGPSTIVGSAAFNLLMIIAVCIAVIPSGEVRIIENLPAFYITALFSMGAYLWMAFILLYISPNIVDVWEAVVTLLLLVPLVYVSYKVDRGDLDGFLRLLRVISVEDEELAAKRSNDWKHKPIRSTIPEEEELDPEMETYTLIWHSRTGGWQAETILGKTAAMVAYNKLSARNSRALFSPCGRATEHWFMSRKWGRNLCAYYAEVKGGSFLKFEAETKEIPASTETQQVEVVVRRTGESVDEAVSCAFRTESLSAVAGYDYESLEGTLEFAHGEREKILTLEIPARAEWRRACSFLLMLEELEGQVQFDPADDGGSTSAILTVVLKPLAEYAGSRSARKAIDRVMCLYALQLGLEDWKEQLMSWFYVNGSKEEQQEASKVDWFFHVVGLPWKLMSALTPPTSFFGGWLCFYVSLGGIAFLTAAISDLAELLGCVIGVPAIVTAVSLVALGTSMPDLFASYTAAREDDTADASVVNVTGSNSVNVFLGLGVPWTMAAVYWAIVGRTDDWLLRYPEMAAELSGAGFVVDSRNLGYTVLGFCWVCILALLILYLRRRWLGAELGGPVVPKYVASFTFAQLWLVFVVLVSWRVLRWDTSLDPANSSIIMGMTVWVEGAIVQGCSFLLTVISIAVTIVVTRRYKKVRRHKSVGSEEGEEEQSNSSEWWAVTGLTGFLRSVSSASDGGPRGSSVRSQDRSSLSIEKEKELAQSKDVSFDEVSGEAKDISAEFRQFMSFTC